MYITELLEGKVLRIGDIEIKLVRIKAGRKAMLLIKAPNSQKIERIEDTWIKPSAPLGLRIVEE